MQQIELFGSEPRDLISEDAVAHWKHMVSTEGKKWPYLLPYYQSMLDFNQRRLVFGWYQAGPMPKHPHEDEDTILPLVVLPTVGYMVNPCGEWHRYCKGLSGFNAVLPISWSY